VPIGLSWTAAPSGISVKRIRGIVGKTAVKFNIPEVEAVDRLKDLIREHGKWVETVPQGSAVKIGLNTKSGCTSIAPSGLTPANRFPGILARAYV